jgi:hypothetical protein
LGRGVCGTVIHHEHWKPKAQGFLQNFSELPPMVVCRDDNSEATRHGLGRGSPFPARFKVDEFVRSRKPPCFVIPAEAGIQSLQGLLDSRLRGSDDLGDFLRDHQGCLF